MVALKGKKIGYIYNCLKQKKWELNFCYNPFGFQYLVTQANLDKIDNFLTDLKDIYIQVIDANNIRVNSMIKLILNQVNTQYQMNTMIHISIICWTL